MTERLVGVEQVAQLGKPVAARIDDTVERLEHEFVAGLVEKQLDTQVFGVLQFQ